MLNKVFLIGHLGADPEVRQTQGGSVCNLRVATTEKWTDKSGQRRERTEWHSVTVWGAQGESCARYLAKGRQVHVEGRLQSSEWQDKDGNNRRSWSIVASRVTFLGGGQSGGGQGQARQRPERQPAQQGGWGDTGGRKSGDGGWGQYNNGGDPPF